MPQDVPLTEGLGVGPASGLSVQFITQDFPVLATATKLIDAEMSPQRAGDEANTDFGKIRALKPDIAGGELGTS